MRHERLARRMGEASKLLARARATVEAIEGDSGAEMLPAKVAALRAELDAITLAYEQLEVRKREAAEKWAELFGTDPRYMLVAEIGARVMRTIR